MNYNYSNDISNFYLHITDENHDSEVNDFRVQMLLHNKLDGFIPLNITYTDNIPEYTYNITGLTLLESECNNSKITMNNFTSLINSLNSLLYLCDKYLLNPDNLMFTNEFTYINPENFNLSLCYCPFYSESFKENFYNFICFLLNKIDYDDSALVEIIYDLQKDCAKIELPVKIILDRVVAKFSEKVSIVSDEMPSGDCLVIGTDSEKLSAPLKPCKINKYLMNDAEKKKLHLRQLLPYIKLTCGSILTYITLIVLQIKFDLLSTAMIVLLIPVLLGIIGYSIFKIIKLRESYYEGPIIKELVTKHKEISSNVSCKNTRENAIDGTSEATNRTTIEGTSQIISETAVESADIMNISDTTEDIHSLHDTPIIEDDENSSRLVPEDKVHYDVIKLTSYPFTIGKISGNTDGYIFSPLVSRVHGRITFDDGNFFIQDLNSANGTYLNDKKMKPETLYPLKSGDIIGFSTIKYTFLCI